MATDNRLRLDRVIINVYILIKHMDAIAEDNEYSDTLAAKRRYYTKQLMGVISEHIVKLTELMYIG